MQKDFQAQLAIASVPCQSWGDLYEADKALVTGTIFPALDMPFYITDNQKDTLLSSGTGGSADPLQKEREHLMNRIYQVSFFLDDLILYLDTHEKDPEAIRLFAAKNQERQELLTQFAEQFYPLTRACIAKCPEAQEEFLWEKGPIPWEGACV